MRVSKLQNLSLKYTFKKKIETVGYGHWALFVILERFIFVKDFMTVGSKWTTDHSGNRITVLETFRMWKLCGRSSCGQKGLE